MQNTIKYLLTNSFIQNHWVLICAGSLLLCFAVITTVDIFWNPKAIGYVNSGEILKRYKGAEDANKKFEAESKVWDENIKILQRELDSLNFLFVRDGNKWGDAKKKELISFAKRREDDLQRYTQAILQKASSRQKELLQPVLADINNVISEYGKKEGYAMILGTTDGNIVYADNSVNVTEKVLELLNK